jgi:transposase InsO family protein
VAAPAIAAGHATHDRPAGVSLLPSQLPTLEVLRRPVEFTQYLAIRYTERLADAGAVTSVGSRGDSYDNALAESVNGLYKTELIRTKGPWRTADAVELATAAWVAWWNAERLHGACGDIPPAEFEAAYHQRLQEATAAA